MAPKTLPQLLQDNITDVIRNRRRRVECCRIWHRLPADEKIGRRLAAYARKNFGATPPQQEVIASWPADQLQTLKAMVTGVLLCSGQPTLTAKFSAMKKAGASPSISIALSARDNVMHVRFTTPRTL